LNLSRVRCDFPLHALVGDLSQLPSPTTGRLLEFEDPPVRELLKQAVEETRIPWQLPQWTSLKLPGAELVRTLVSVDVSDVAMSADGRQAVSVSWHKTLNVCDLETGRELRTLCGHSDRFLYPSKRI
jgi:hypothetical protein